MFLKDIDGMKGWENQWSLVAKDNKSYILSFNDLPTLFLYYKNTFYKNIEAEIVKRISFCDENLKIQHNDRFLHMYLAI